MEQYMVSVCCLAFNHKDYIRKCLDSILEQETSYPFEIIIHDDASTDGTTEILLEYKKTYGDRIRLILQKENQYSKGIDVLRNFVFPSAKGKYLAFCEGDDCWCDPNKLEIQISYMEEHENASWCAHFVQCMYESGEIIANQTLPPIPSVSETKMMSSRETLRFLVKNGIQMTSYFIRNDSFQALYKDTPRFVEISPVDDEAIVRFCAISGDLLFITKIMSKYRIHSKGSWTSQNDSDALRMSIHYERMLNMLKSLDDYTEKRYHDVISDDCIDKEWKLAWFRKDYQQMMKRRFSEYRAALPLKTRIKISLLSARNMVQDHKKGE